MCSIGHLFDIVTCLIQCDRSKRVRCAAVSPRYTSWLFPGQALMTQRPWQWSVIVSSTVVVLLVVALVVATVNGVRRQCFMENHVSDDLLHAWRLWNVPCMQRFRNAHLDASTPCCLRPHIHSAPAIRPQSSILTFTPRQPTRRLVRYLQYLATSSFVQLYQCRPLRLKRHSPWALQRSATSTRNNLENTRTL